MNGAAAAMAPPLFIKSLLFISFSLRAIGQYCLIIYQIRHDFKGGAVFLAAELLSHPRFG
jgi:hypothetical protein